MWAVIQHCWCPYKKELGHRHREREDHGMIQEDDAYLQAMKTSKDASPANIMNSAFQLLQLGESELLLIRPAGHVQIIHFPVSTLHCNRETS